MNLLNRIKRRKLVTLSLIALLLTSATATAVIVRSEETDYIYYDDYGNIVGEYTVPCIGRTFGWGEQTANVVSYTISCQPPTPPPPYCPNCIP